MKLYTLRLSLRGVSPLIWRRLHVPGITSLATLHDAIQIVNGWDNEYLHRFHIYAVDYGISYSGGMSFRKNAHHVFLDDFEFSAGDKFFYEYNFFENNIVDIRIEAIAEKDNCNKKIDCIKGNGMPGVTKADVSDAQYNFMKAIINMKPDEKLEKIVPLAEALQELQFSDQRANQKLSSELTEQF
jgi:hypothetical protein